MSFSGEAVSGKWQTLVLGKGEQIIKVKANMCDRYVRGIGFFLWKNGMGLPNYTRDLHDDEEDKDAAEEKKEAKGEASPAKAEE